MSTAALMERIELEANWGLSHAHQKTANRNCNACRALEIIVTITQQVRGIKVAHPVDLRNCEVDGQNTETKG